MSPTQTTNRIESPPARDDNGLENTRVEASTADETTTCTTDELGNSDAAEQVGRSRSGRQVSLSVRTLMTTAVMCMLAATTGGLGWLYLGARADLHTQAAQAGGAHRAEEIAIDYAVNAAQMDYQDFAAWKAKLVNGTSPELKDKLAKAADSVEQVLAPLQWQSTALPLAAKVHADTAGVYTVDAFVSVLTKTMQAPGGLQSTATYSITIDSHNTWQITDVGGIDAALGRG